MRTFRLLRTWQRLPRRGKAARAEPTFGYRQSGAAATEFCRCHSFFHREREHHGADDLQREALQHRNELDWALALGAGIGNSRINGSCRMLC